MITGAGETGNSRLGVTRAVVIKFLQGNCVQGGPQAIQPITGMNTENYTKMKENKDVEKDTGSEGVGSWVPELGPRGP